MLQQLGSALGSYPLLPLIFLIPLLVLLISSKRGLSKKANLPPSPPKLPIIGNLHQVGALPHRSLRALSDKYGPLMLLQLGQVPTVVVSSADMAREFMRTHDLIFASRPYFRSAEILSYNFKDIIFAPYGDDWRNARKLCTVHLLSHKRVKSYQLMIEEEVAFMINQIKKACSAASPRPVDMTKAFKSFSNDMICRVVSGKLHREDGLNEMFLELLDENARLVGEFSVENYFPSLRWVDQFFKKTATIKANFVRMDGLLTKVVEHHRRRKRGHEEEEEEDFVDVLLSLKDDGEEMSDELIKALVFVCS